MMILLNAGHQNKLASTNTGHKIKILKPIILIDRFTLYILMHFRKDNLLQAIVHTKINVYITNVT